MCSPLFITSPANTELYSTFACVEGDMSNETEGVGANTYTGEVIEVEHVEFLIMCGAVSCLPRSKQHCI